MKKSVFTLIAGIITSFAIQAEVVKDVHAIIGQKKAHETLTAPMITTIATLITAAPKITKDEGQALLNDLRSEAASLREEERDNTETGWMITGAEPALRAELASSAKDARLRLNALEGVIRTIASKANIKLT